MKHIRERGITLALLITCFALACAPWIRQRWQSIRLLKHFQSQEMITGVPTEDITYRAGRTTIRARLYGDCQTNPPLLLLHGVHAEGIDAPRLRTFATQLTDVGFSVLTPRLDALQEFRFSTSSLDQIRIAADYLSERCEWTSIGVIGISFAGGLAIVAASEQPEASPIGAVLSVGGHYDLYQLSHWWLGNEIEGPNGIANPLRAARYGPQVLAYTFAEALFTERDTSAARDVLHAAITSHPIPERTLSRQANAWVQQLRQHQLSADLRSRLTQVVQTHSETLRRLSPKAHLQSLRVPLFVIHGAEDPIVAVTEAEWLRQHAPNTIERRTVITGLLRHAEPGSLENWQTQWQLVDLIARFFSRAGA